MLKNYAEDKPVSASRGPSKLMAKFYVHHLGDDSGIDLDSQSTSHPGTGCSLQNKSIPMRVQPMGEDHATKIKYPGNQQGTSSDNHDLATNQGPWSNTLTTRNQTFLQWYDLRICLYRKNQLVLSKWEALNLLLDNLKACDPTIWVYPWQSEDYSNYPPIQFSEPVIPFFNLAIYAPRLTGQQASRTQHPYLFLQSSVAPTLLVDSLGTWFRETKQGMWPQQLVLAEQTKCLGWLLYSAPEYHLEEL